MKTGCRRSGRSRRRPHSSFARQNQSNKPAKHRPAYALLCFPGAWIMEASHPTSRFPEHRASLHANPVSLSNLSQALRACRTVCRRDGPVRGLPATHECAGRAASDGHHKRTGPSAGGALSGPPLLPPTKKSTGLPKAAWIGIAATALIGVIVAIVVVLLNTKDRDAEKQTAANTERAQPIATPPDSLPKQTPNKSPGSHSTNNSTAPPVRATPAEPVPPATSRAPANTTNDRASTVAGNTNPPNQVATSAAPSNRWLKPFVPKNDDDSADAARKAKPSVNATPNVWNVKPDPAPQQITSGEIKWSEVEVPVLDRGHGMVHPLRPSPLRGDLRRGSRQAARRND